MLIENFNFNDFFNTKNITHNQKIKEYGIGATSIITPRQVVTRINDPDLEYRIPGLGHHNITEQNIARKILINEEQNNIPKKLSVKDFKGWFAKKITNEEYNEKRRKQSNTIQKFLNSIVRIYYVSSSAFDSVMIKLPSFVKDDSNKLGNCNLKISEEMYEGIKVILEQLKKAQIPCDSINVDGQEFFESYGQIDEYLNTLIDLNFIFPFKENIIVTQQIEQKKDEEIR